VADTLSELTIACIAIINSTAQIDLYHAMGLGKGVLGPPNSVLQKKIIKDKML
jgi:hypothetical protein